MVMGHWALVISLPALCSPASSSLLPHPFHQYFNSELVNLWLWDFYYPSVTSVEGSLFSSSV